MAIILIVGATLLALGVYTRVQSEKIEAQFPPIGKFADVGGYKLHYLDLAPEGETDLPPILFIHGASGNLLDQTQAFRSKLEGRARLIFVDRPGHGWSERGGEENSSPQGQSAAIAKLLEVIGVEKAIIVGHSWGGAVTGSFGVLHPEKALGLLFLAPATHPWPGGIRYYYKLASTPLLGWLLTETVILPIGKSSLLPGAKSVFAPNKIPDDYLENTGAMLLLRPHEFRNNANDVARLSDNLAKISPRYSEIKLPTIIITGDSDDVVLEEIHSQGLKRQIEGAELIVLPNVGHKPDYVAVDIAIDAIERLAKQSKAARQ